MTVNPNFYLALILGSALFLLSVKLFGKFGSIKSRYFTLIISVILVLISLAIPMAYFFFLFGANPHYATFRTMPYTELLVVLAAPFAGGVAAGLAARKTESVTKRVIFRACLLVTIFYISLPFIKPMIRPLQKEIGNQWSGNVALQTTASTCGPSSLATVLNHYGIKDSEANIAHRAFSSASGTENWYLARYAQQKGLGYQFLHEPDLSKVPTPSIIGVKLGRVGHFITLYGSSEGRYDIADSLSGLQQMTLEEFEQKYQYDGFVLHIR